MFGRATITLGIGPHSSFFLGGGEDGAGDAAKSVVDRRTEEGI